MSGPAPRLDDKYLSHGLAFMTGIHALVRLPLLQKARDEAAGLDTAGFISGYRGSPLARYDIELARAKEHLDHHSIHVWPGINEDLAATAVWGSQQSGANGRGKRQGVFAIWYAKGPGVDRSGDALRHANLAGSSKYGGVLALLGDDHTCESSSTAHQSEWAMVDYQLPVLNPATVSEIIELGLHGWAMSRFSGSWVALKCIHDTVEASAVVDLALSDIKTTIPIDCDLPLDGLNLRVPDDPISQEERQHRYKARAAQAYARANCLDRALLPPGPARVGIVTTGKAHTDFLQAFTELGVDLEALRAQGIGIFKVAMSWPLEPKTICEFCEELDLVIVIEEKRSLIEDQLKTLLYGRAERPAVIGKLDEEGNSLFPSAGALSSHLIATGLRRAFSRRFLGEHPFQAPSMVVPANSVAKLSLVRLPPLLRRVSTQYLDQGAAGESRNGRYRLQLHGAMDGPRNLGIYSYGRRRRVMDWGGTVQQGRSHLSKHGRWHLFPLGLACHSGHDRRGCEYYVQDTLQ